MWFEQLQLSGLLLNHGMENNISGEDAARNKQAIASTMRAFLRRE
jgi:hypothetical protein